VAKYQALLAVSCQHRKIDLLVLLPAGTDQRARVNFTIIANKAGDVRGLLKYRGVAQVLCKLCCGMRSALWRELESPLAHELANVGAGVLHVRQCSGKLP